MPLFVKWEEVKDFLCIDKGHSQSRVALCSEMSRFNVIERWFSDKEWSRDNFRGLILHYINLGRSQSTRNKLIRLGKHLDELQNTKVVATFKTKKERLPKINFVLSKEEMIQIAETKIFYKKYCDYINQRQLVLIKLLATTGCRISEALNLQWENIKKERQKFVEFLNTKNGEDRSVVINEDLFENILKLPRKSSFVFNSIRNEKLTSQQVNADIKKRAKKIGIEERVHCHLFRHSFTTNLLERGVSDSDVCKIAGWRDPKTLLRYKNSPLDYYAGVMAFAYRS